jgi:hypothetical protein
MGKCPYCGAEISEGAVYCPTCHRSLMIGGYSRWAMSSSRPRAMGSFLLAIVLLLVLVLPGYVLFALQPEVAGVYALFASLMLGWLGARGRYDLPTTRQYLLTMFIALIPVVGTAYALYFAGSYLAQRRGLRVLAYVVLLIGLGLLLLMQIGMGEFDLQGALAQLRRQATPTPLLTPTPVPTATLPPSATQRPSPTVRLSATPSAESESPGLSDCLLWSEVTIDLVGQEACVHGDYSSVFQKQDGTYVLSFSDEPGTFQVWSSPRPIQPYLPQDGSLCVVVRGWIKTSGVRPIVVIGSQGKLEGCP